MGILQTHGAWRPEHDAKLNSLHSLLAETCSDRKVLVFSQFADTVRYLEGQLEDRDLRDMAGVTGNSEEPTAFARRFSPVSNQTRDTLAPEQELRVLVATDVLSEGQNLQDCAIVVNYDLPWAIIRLIQRAVRVDRIGQTAEEILCHSFLPAEGVERIIDLRDRVRRRLEQNAEVVGADEAFFEDEPDEQTILNLYHERAGILDGDPDGEVDLASHAYQIWKNAISADPRLERAVTNLPDVIFSSRQHLPIAQRPEGVLVFVRTPDGNDALAYVGRDGKSITESQLEILAAAECKPDTPAQPRHEIHHGLVEAGVKHIAREEQRVGGQLGRASGVRFRTYTRLKAYADSIKGQLFDLPALHQAHDDISGKTLQVWQWVKREAGKPAACREQEYRTGQTGAPILQRLQTIAFALEEEAGLNILQVASRVSQAMDVERVTKRFYDRFRTELTAFQGFISGITAQGDREWYASLMLNRMMFVYFVQKQGFLDDDPDYLRNRLNVVQAQSSGGRFLQFYRIFLLRLFHEGLGQPEAERAPELAELLGRIPFLNGGLFDVHDLERDNPDISIPDEAFHRVFSFFDGYRWHLDERPRREDNEINPDVLDYIFEKYVNQKQMGAYYTKEDITGYISRNTVIPFLFDAARKECPVAFNPGGGVWRLLQDDPDRYIYPAVGHGLAWIYTPDAAPVRLEQTLELPEDIAAGLDDVPRRSGWNRPAPDEYALPTETWREVVARRRRYAEVRAKLAAGEVSDVNDLITLNLDAEQFAKDVIVQSEGPELLRAFWHSLRDVSVLDPTCGSRAFLFAALNILEPLYTAWLEGMRGFLDDLERTQRPRHPQALSDFRDVLEQADRHPSPLLHPQVHRAEQPLRRGHHGRGCGNLQAAPLPQAGGPVGGLRPDRAAARH